MDQRETIHPFNYEGVQLLGGRFKEQFSQIRDYYCAIPNDDLLKGFRKRSGLPAPGNDLGGWYSKDVFHTFGQWLSAFARMYRATQEKRIRDKVIHLMEEWAKTIDEDGYFFYSERPNAPHYIYEKMVGGLVDIYEYIGDRNALHLLARITDWAEENLDRSNLYSHTTPQGCTEWYTLSENLYRAYELTNEQRYRDFAKVWEYTDFWDHFAQRRDIFEALRDSDATHYHAYSHVNTLNGAAMAYKVTGAHHYLDAIVNAFRYLLNTQVFATGGYGPNECLIAPDGLAETLKDIYGTVFHFETACGSWAAFKLSRYLMSFTGDAFYGDWIEQLVYNGVGALIPIDTYGAIMYGSRYHLLGAQKCLMHTWTWSCCTGTLPIAVADYHNLIYFHDDENLYINLFIPSKAEWKRPCSVVSVVQETRFPEQDTVRLHVSSESPSRFGLRFRIPLWSGNNATVRVNNALQKTHIAPGRWATVERNWSTGDKVTLRFDLSPRIKPLTGFVSPVAVLSGPVVMVATSDQHGTPVGFDIENPSKWLRRSKKRYEYSTHMESWTETFRPYYEIAALEPYRMYHVRPGCIAIPETEMIFYDAGTGGQWVTEGNLHFADAPGSYFEAAFEGTAVEWKGFRREDGGKAKVCIDGRDVAEVDQYGYTGLAGLIGWPYVRTIPNPRPFVWSASNLGRGKHTIRVTICSDKNPYSRGTTVNIKSLKAYP